MIRVAVVMVVVCALAWSSAALGQAQELDLQAYKPSTLEKLFAATPKSRDAEVELLATDELARVEATWTGQQRASPEAGPLVMAWAQRSQMKGGRRLAEFPDLELEDGGKRYWLRVGYPAATMLEGNSGRRLSLLVHRIGFAKGRPVVVIFIMASPEKMREALARPAAPKQAAPPARAPENHFTTGQIRFVHLGKPYVIPLHSPPANPSRHAKNTAYGGTIFHSVGLGFGPGAVEANVSMHVPAVGEFDPAQHPVSFELIVMMRGVMIDLHGKDFPGCKLRMSQLEAAGVKGKMSCAKPPPGGVSEIEFSAAP